MQRDFQGHRVSWRVCHVWRAVSIAQASAYPLRRMDARITHAVAAPHACDPQRSLCLSAAGGTYNGRIGFY
ncbi:hypothetical protein CHLRE_12g537371v5 [Chlamydomonas reinhardtii]|uniref:Uncharacterized protein n=1 Tax=Chlamydomonas reinhardtii TaxID=3055 RepID=A0A2K3D595_CHLRE|nr:uncharacterized protein CHLRE_12g537371v5 [Chlamydomonas reinhardtii]PNW75699.1 hypothetical protein CHLRE_12g537371v5 [Chlamydomonas reinhardtii]